MTLASFRSRLFVCIALFAPATARAASYELDLHVHAEGEFPDMVDEQGAPVNEASAGSVLLPVVSAAKATRPVGSQWDFTGTTSGGSLWILPKSPNQSVLYLGIGTEEIAPSDLAGDITLVFQGLSGPAGGVFSMWDVDSFAQLVPLVSSATGFATPNQLALVANTHEHFNYGFTTPGLYDVTFQASATLSPALGGGPVMGTATFSFGVFDVGDDYPEEPTTPYTFFGRTFDNFIYDNGHVDLGIALAPVPEPSTLVMAGLGLGAVAAAGIRRRMSRPATRS